MPEFKPNHTFRPSPSFGQPFTTLTKIKNKNTEFKKSQISTIQIEKKLFLLHFEMKILYKSNEIYTYLSI